MISTVINVVEDVFLVGYHSKVYIDFILMKIILYRKIGDVS